MEGPEDIIEWQVDITSPGLYDVFINYAAIPEWEDCSYIVESDNGSIKATIKSTQGWYEYKTEKIGRFNISETGVTIFSLYPENQLDHYLMYFKAIVLIPVQSSVTF